MIKYMKKIATIILILVLNNACDFLEDTFFEKWYPLDIQNNYNKEIFVSIGCDRFWSTSYPDTILPSTKPYLISVSPNDYVEIDSGKKWEDIAKKQPEGKLSIYFFDSDTIEFYDWAQIKEGNKVMKRIDVSAEDLINMNWTITYP